MSLSCLNYKPTYRAPAWELYVDFARWLFSYGRDYSTLLWCFGDVWIRIAILDVGLMVTLNNCKLTPFNLGNLRFWFSGSFESKRKIAVTHQKKTGTGQRASLEGRLQGGKMDLWWKVPASGDILLWICKGALLCKFYRIYSARKKTIWPSNPFY